MKKYKFEQFKNPIECESWVLMQINDNCESQTAFVTIKLTDKSGVNYAHRFDNGYSYTKDLAKSEVTTWVSNELKKYEV